MDILLPWRQNANRSTISGGDPNAVVGRGVAPAPVSPGGGREENNIPKNSRRQNSVSDNNSISRKDYGIENENNPAANRHFLSSRGLGGNAAGDLNQQRPNGGGFLNSFRFLDPQNLFRQNLNENLQQNQFKRDPLLDNTYRQPNRGNQENASQQSSSDINGSFYGGNSPSISSFISSSPLQSVLDELNMSILPHDVRLAAIMKASQLFDHRDRTKHDYELNEGAARILYQKLAFVLSLCLQSNFGNGGYSYDSHNSYNMPVTQGRGMKMKKNVHINGVHANHSVIADDDASATANTSISSFGNDSFVHDESSRSLGTHAKPRNSISSNATTSIVSMQRMRSTRSPQASGKFRMTRKPS